MCAQHLCVYISGLFRSRLARATLHERPQTIIPIASKASLSYNTISFHCTSSTLGHCGIESGFYSLSI